MTHAHVPARRRALLAASLLTFPLLRAAADVEGTTIPLAPYGDTDGGPAGSVTPLSSEVFALSLKGPDGVRSTDDDAVAVVTWDDAGSTVTSIPVPYSANWGGGITVASATRAAILGAGEDGFWATGDDCVWILDRLGSDNVAFPVVVGFISSSDVHTPVWLDVRTLVVTTRGSDGQRSSDDDSVALVTDVGGTNSVTHLATPFTPAWSRGRPVALSSTSFLITSDGPDGAGRTADDGVFLFTAVGSANTRTDLATPGLFDYGASVPVRLTATRAVVCSTGADLAETTADDVLLVLEDLARTPHVDPVPVPNILRYGGGLPVRIGADVVLVGSAGADGQQRTADDEIVAVHDIGGKDAKADGDVVGGLEEDAASRPVMLDADTAAVATGGPDGIYQTADDEVVVLDHLGPGTEVLRLAMPCLSDRVVSRPVPTGRDSFLVSHGGPDGVFDSADDRVSHVTGATAVPSVQATAVPWTLDDDVSGHRPRLIGHGHAAIVCPGGDSTQGAGGDDLCFVLRGLPSRRDVVVTSLTATFNVAKPTKAAVFSVRAKLTGDGFVPFSGNDVTVSVGNAAQTLAASDFRGRKGVWTYADPRRRKGFVSKVAWNQKTGALTVSARGVRTGIETTNLGCVPFSVAAGELLFADAVAATQTKSGFRFRAPR